MLPFEEKYILAFRKSKLATIRVMRALRVKDGLLLVDSVEKPSNQNEAIIRVLKSGICNTDLEIVRGYAGFTGTVGHEFVGIVERSDNKPELIGKRVVGEINAGCGVCELCRNGDPRHCPTRTVLGIHGRDGTHAEFLSLPPENLLEVPAEVTDDEAVFAEPLAAAYGITEQIEILPDTRVAVVGDGKLGLLCGFSLCLRTKELTLIGKHPEKLVLARNNDTAIETLLAADAEKLNRRFDVVVEASGSESGFAAALDLVKTKGKIVLKSTFHGRTAFEASRVVVDEITIVGSRCGRFAPALELLASKKVNVSAMISHEFALAEGVKAMDVAARKGVIKILLDMSLA